ncbi:MAG: methyl-accepting chemotaxis protein [Pirellulales bacterium]
MSLTVFRPDGQLYTKMFNNMEMGADFTPPALYLMEPYLLSHQLASAENDQERKELFDAAQKLREIYNTRLEYWKGILPEGESRRRLIAEVDPLAQRFFNIQFGEYRKALEAGDRQRADDLVDETLNQIYHDQEKVIDSINDVAVAENDNLRKEANSIFSSRVTIMIVLATSLCVALTGLAVWLAREILRVVKANVEGMEAATKGDYSRRVNVAAGGELGRMNVALNLMLDSLIKFEASAVDYQAQVSAVDRANAVVEFGLDGTVIRANDNFLKTMGYSSDEIVGRHHRIFVDATEAASIEYRQFWDDLRAGKSSSGEFQRFGKGNREVWVQGIYNPILDADGKPQRVIKYVIDITENKRLELDAKRKAELDQEAAAEQSRKVEQVLQIVNGMADGNFAQVVPDLGDDAVGQVATALVDATRAVREALVNVREVAAGVGSSSTEVREAATEIASGAQVQASSLEETAASLEEITSAVKQNTESALRARGLAANSQSIAEAGGKVVGDAVKAMSAISESSKRIAEIITTIDEIAFQTNLLALNAAVEAARAGEQGRGFAVVASEVRSLAQRSATAAREIKSLIQDSVSKVDNGTSLVNKSGATLTEIVQSVQSVAGLVDEISAASTEQLSGLEQVNSAISQMDHVTQSNAAKTDSMSMTSTELSHKAESLQVLVDRFQLDNRTKTGTPLNAGRGMSTSSATKKAAARPTSSDRRPAPIVPDFSADLAGRFVGMTQEF